jgi:iron complex outermembrane recepter protein
MKQRGRQMTIETRPKVYGCLAGAAWGIGAVVNPSWAQDTAVQPGLEVVVVTAQKRAESAQDVPLSISAFTSADLEAKNITNFDHLAQHTPGLSAETAGSSRPFYYLRGYGTGSFDVQSDPAIAIYVDEVYSSRFSATQMSLFDIERVEVLKGPQGTLFGRNAAGGAISVITKKPSDEFAASVALDAGDHSSIGARAAIGGPISEHWKARMNAAWHERDGYVTDTATGRSVDDRSSAGGRLQLLWEPRTARCLPRKSHVIATGPGPSAT